MTLSPPPGADGVRLTKEPDYDAEMRLPAGVTCDDCAHAKRCFGFGFSEAGRTSCDFWPNRYRAALSTPPKDNDHE